MAQQLVDDGLEFITDVLDSGAGQVALPADLYIAWGTSGTAPAAGDTALGAEASETRVAVTSDQSTATTNRYVATITADGTKTIQEAGLLTASTSGVLIIRGTHTAVPVNASDQIQYTFTMAHTAA